MRLIDADKLLKKEHLSYSYLADEFYVRKSDIENAPTIEERQKAEWIDVRDYCGEFMCSNCKETNINNSYKYCPYCGADMR